MAHTEIEIAFESQRAQFFGTLCVPKDNLKNIFCLFVPGSFPQTRDGNIDESKTQLFPTPLPKRNLFRDEAQILASAGVASFRYDKRGSGKSGGRYEETGLWDLVEDAANAIRALKNRHEFRSSKCCVIGQSEGAAVGTLLAVKDPDLVDLLVWQGGLFEDFRTGTTPQRDDFLKKSRAEQDFYKKNVPLLYHFYRQYDNFWKAVENQASDFKLGDHEWSYSMGLKLFREHQKKPIKEVLPQLTCPLVILHGGLDGNSPVSEATQAHEMMLKHGKSSKLQIFADLDHSFRNVGQSGKNFVQSMADPIDPSFAEYLVQVFRNY